MKYIIMADGKEKRWKNYLGIPKHLVEVNGEKLICRTVRLLNLMIPENSEITVTSHDKSYEFESCCRHEPLNNALEIDRFTEELIDSNICFLYGDTYYTLETMKTIIETNTESIVFFGNEKSIVAVKVADAEAFRYHKQRVRDMFLKGEIANCKGWQLYQSFSGQDLSCEPEIKDNFIRVDKDTMDINTPEDYRKLI